MLAPYPIYNPDLANTDAEAAYDIVLGCARGVRSLLAEYTLVPPATPADGVTTPAPVPPAEVFVQGFDEDAYQIVEREVASVRALSFTGAGKAGVAAGEVVVLRPGDARPAGCVAFPVSRRVGVLMRVKGRVDLKREVEKAEKRLERARAAVARQRTAMGEKGYVEKVAVATREADRRRLEDLETEVGGLEATVGEFERLMIE